MTRGCNINDIRVIRMDAYAGDLFQCFEAEVLPGLATVNRLVHAVAPRDALTHVGLAEAYVQDIGVLLGHGDGAN